MRFLARPLTVLIIFLAVVAGVAINLAVGEASKVGWVIIGLLVSTVLQVVIEAYKKQQESIEIAKALYDELADRVGRCLFDFEEPWSNWYMGDQGWGDVLGEDRLRKFKPISPIIYPAVAGKLAALGDEIPQPVNAFFTSLSSLQQDMQIHADLLTGDDDLIPVQHAKLIADRYHRTLSPGLDALDALGKLVPHHAAIDAFAMKRRDKLFEHERSGQPMRERLKFYVEKDGPYLQDGPYRFRKRRV